MLEEIFDFFEKAFILDHPFSFWAYLKTFEGIFYPLMAWRNISGLMFPSLKLLASNTFDGGVPLPGCEKYVC